MTTPRTEALALVLFAAAGFDQTKWLDMPGDAGNNIRGHYRKLAAASIAWLEAEPTIPIGSSDTFGNRRVFGRLQG